MKIQKFEKIAEVEATVSVLIKLESLLTKQKVLRTYLGKSPFRNVAKKDVILERIMNRIWVEKKMNVLSNVDKMSIYNEMTKEEILKWVK